VERKDIEERVRQWEAEGYDVSELKAKWFSKGGGGRSPAWVVLPVGAAIVVLLILLSGWSPWSPGQAPIVPPRDPATFTLTTAITPSGSGSVSPSSGTYDDGTRVTLTASPASGYGFSHWSGDATGTSPTTTVTMNRNISVTANFALVARYKLSTAINPSGSGSVTPSSGTYDDGTRVTLTASPASGYGFSHWSGDATGTSPTTTVTMNRNISVTASFSKEPSQCVTEGLKSCFASLVLIRNLQAGDTVEGSASTTKRIGMLSSRWGYVITGPGGSRVDQWEGSARDIRYVEFEFVAGHAGEYRVEAYTLDCADYWRFTVCVWPPGWQ